MHKKFLTVIIFCFASHYLFSQQMRSDTTITQVITFESSSLESKYKKPVYKKNSVGIGLLSWVEGYVPFYYERQIFKFLSVKVGAGLTFRSFTNDLGMIIWNDGDNSEYFDPYYGNYEDVHDHYANYTFRKATIGYYFSFAPKFYVHSEGMHGFTVYPMLEYKHFSFKAKQARTDLSAANSYAYDDIRLQRYPNTYQQEHMNCVDFTVNVGGHYQTSSMFFIEWRLGIGIRKSFSDRLDVGIDQNTDRFINNNRSYEKLKPILATDIIVGGLF